MNAKTLRGECGLQDDLRQILIDLDRREIVRTDEASCAELTDVIVRNYPGIDREELLALLPEVLGRKG